MKIAFFIPSLRGGGAERVFVLLANNFVNQGVEVDMVLINKRGKYLNNLDEKINIIGLNCPKLWTSVRSFIKYLRNSSPSAVVSSMPLANTIAVTAQKLSSYSGPVILTHHNTQDMFNGYVEKLSHKLFVPWVQWSYKIADKIICVSNGVANSVNRIVNDKSKIEVVYNPINVNSIIKRSNFPVEGFDKSKKNIVAVGRLVEQKDFETLIKTIPILKEKLDANLTILGEGKRRHVLEKLISELEVKDSVYLKGFVENPFKYLSASDVFVLSSKHEGFGNVIVEAMACETQVVSTDCPSGPSEILEKGRYGKLVPVGDSKAMANAILNTLENPIVSKKKLVNRARDFSTSKIAENYLDVIQSSINEI